MQGTCVQWLMHMVVLEFPVGDMERAADIPRRIFHTTRYVQTRVEQVLTLPGSP